MFSAPSFLRPVVPSLQTFMSNAFASLTTACANIANQVDSYLTSRTDSLLSGKKLAHMISGGEPTRYMESPFKSISSSSPHLQNLPSIIYSEPTIEIHPDYLTDLAPKPAAVEVVPQSVTSFFPVVEGYQLLEQIGEGGSAVVYKAIHEETGVLVAVKVYQPRFAIYGVREFHIQRQNISQIVTARELKKISIVNARGVSQETVALVMDYIPGKSCEEVIERIHALPADTETQILHRTTTILGMFRQSLNPVVHLHQRGVVHRDLKSENYRFGIQGQSSQKMILLDCAGGVTSVDNGYSFIGGPDYSAPESFLVKDPHSGRVYRNLVIDGKFILSDVLENVGHEADMFNQPGFFQDKEDKRLPGFLSPHAQKNWDVYSLGRLFAHAITNDYCETDPRVIRNAVIRLGLPIKIFSLIMKAIQVDPALRFQDAGEMLAELNVIISLRAGLLQQLPSIANPALANPVRAPLRVVTPLPPAPVKRDTDIATSVPRISFTYGLLDPHLGNPNHVDVVAMPRQPVMVHGAQLARN